LGSFREPVQGRRPVGEVSTDVHPLPVPRPIAQAGGEAKATAFGSFGSGEEVNHVERIAPEMNLRFVRRGQPSERVEERPLVMIGAQRWPGVGGPPTLEYRSGLG
jgi:hypothetical protein